MELKRKIQKKSCNENYKHFNDLLLQGKFYDITLQTEDGTKINAHRNILYVGSGFFRNLFTSGMEDAKANIIPLKQMKGIHLEKIISFIYYGEIEMDIKEDIEKIAQHANYLQMQDLLNECLHLLEELIDDSNCLRYWRLATECFAKQLEFLCISHIQKSSRKFLKDEHFVNSLTVEEARKLLLTSQEGPPLPIFRIQDEETKLNLLTKELFVILGNEIKTISSDGIVSNFQASMRNNSECYGYTTFKNHLLFCGGIVNSTVTNACKLFEPLNKKWYDLPSMEYHRYFPECTIFGDDKLYVCGGKNSENEVLNSTEIFDFGTEKWIPGPEIPEGLFNFGLVSVNNCLFAANANLIWKLDPRGSNDWIKYQSGMGNVGNYFKCVPIGTNVFGFTNNAILRNFDFGWYNSKINAEYSDFNNDNFKICELNEHIYIIHKNTDPLYFDLCKFNIKGNLIFKKEKILYSPHGSIGALVSLCYQK